MFAKFEKKNELPQEIHQNECHCMRIFKSKAYKQKEVQCDKKVQTIKIASPVTLQGTTQTFLSYNYHNSNNENGPVHSQIDAQDLFSFVLDTNKVLPILPPRDHGNKCVVEINLLEKHVDGCPKKKSERPGRIAHDDTVGSYDVIARAVYPSCTTPSYIVDAVRESRKSFNINDPALFGKDIKEVRSRIETVPLLSNSLVNPNENNDCSNTNLPKVSTSILFEADHSTIKPKSLTKTHHVADSCILHEPKFYKEKLRALKKVIDETSSGAHVDRSTKTFQAKFDPFDKKFKSDTYVSKSISETSQPEQVALAAVSSRQLTTMLFRRVPIFLSDESLSFQLDGDDPVADSESFVRSLKMSGSSNLQVVAQSSTTT